MKIHRNYSNKHYLTKIAENIEPLLSFEAIGKDNWSLWRAQLRAKLIDIMGGFPKKAELEPEILSVAEEQDYVREKVVFQSEEGVSVPAYFMMPKNTELSRTNGFRDGYEF